MSDRRSHAAGRVRAGAFARLVGAEAAGGLVLMIAACAALALANSPWSAIYFDALHRKIAGLDVLHWINDALMAVFFLLVGLEIKREAVEGQLSAWRQRVLPGLAALGGMALPALVFVAVNGIDTPTARGWAIPAATDIAFAIGVLSLLGSRVPPSLKVFLTALAIIDDLGAIVVIALFYSEGLNLSALSGAAVLMAALVGLNRSGVARLSIYLPLGAVLWLLVFLSGIHATIAGVLLALVIPLRSKGDDGSPLVRLEHAIQPFVTFLVVPVFGFANAGVSFANLSGEALLAPLPLGVAAGLFLGKQAGVFGMVRLAVRAGWAPMPDGASWRQVYGVSILCGIGFTMSLFIGLLAFPGAPSLQDEVKLGVLMGSVLSGFVGALVLARRDGSRRPH